MRRLFTRKKEEIKSESSEIIDNNSLLTTLEESRVEQEEKAIQRVVSNKPKYIPIVEEIHDTFYTEVDKLLKEAKIPKSLETNKQILIEKRDKLVSLGFRNTKECQEANTEINRLEKLKLENENKDQLIKAINYFSFKYPHYKFITEDSVKKICEKYNLIYGEVNNYIGEVPDLNIQHMLDFKISDEDKCFLEEEHFFGRSWSKIFISYEKYQELKRRNPHFSSHSTYNYTELPMEICAPVKDFDTRGMEIKDKKLSKIEVLDPIVLQPVMFENQKFYLIVTAWGPESSDSLVLNEKHN